MAKHAKPTNLRLVAVTSKRHTKPTGIGMTIPLPHDLAVKWAEKISDILLNLAQEIARENAPVDQTAPEPLPVQENQSNDNLAQS